MVQAVLFGPHSFIAQGKESNATLQERLLQRHILGGLVQDKDFTGNYQWLPTAWGPCLSIVLQKSAAGELQGEDTKHTRLLYPVWSHLMQSATQAAETCLWQGDGGLH